MEKLREELFISCPWVLWMKTYLDTVFPWILLTPSCQSWICSLCLLFQELKHLLHNWNETDKTSVCKVFSHNSVICFLQILCVFGKFGYSVFQEGEICPYWWEKSPTKAYNLIQNVFDVLNCGSVLEKKLVRSLYLFQRLSFPVSRLLVF